jgi:antitoxin YefM
MNQKNILSITEARKKIFDIAEDVQKPGHFYTLTDKGRPKAVLLSADEFDSMVEDLEILGDPQAMTRIKKAEKEINKGEYVSLDALKKELNYSTKKELVVMEKAIRQNKYIVKKQKSKK